MEKFFLCQVSGAIQICLPMFSSDLTDVKFHVFYTGCHIWSSDIVSSVRNRAWGAFDWISIARNLTSFQLGFCTICPTSLFFGHFIENLSISSTNWSRSSPPNSKTRTQLFYLSTTTATTYFPVWRLCVWLLAATADLCIFHVAVKTWLFLLYTSNCLNKQFHKLKLEHNHV